MKKIVDYLKDGVKPWVRQVNGQIQLPKNELYICEEANKIVEATGAKIEYGGNRAYYERPFPPLFPDHISGDIIRMPKQEQFADQSEFYVTRFHELAHWAEVRVNWTGSYAMGELIAELNAASLAEKCKLPLTSLENNTEHIDTWIKEIENDPSWIIHAIIQARKVTDYILSFSRKVERRNMKFACVLIQYDENDFNPTHWANNPARGVVIAKIAPKRPPFDENGFTEHQYACAVAEGHNQAEIDALAKRHGVWVLVVPADDIPEVGTMIEIEAISNSN